MLMPFKSTEAQREWRRKRNEKYPGLRKIDSARNRAWLDLNPDKKEAYRRQSREKNRKQRGAIYDLLAKIKSEPCGDCGGRFDPECMDFDHRDASTKKAAVARIVANWPIEEIVLNEVAKCDLVCANCHRLRTKKRRLLKKSDGL